MTTRRDFTLKDIDVYRPYPDEIPLDLLALAGTTPEQVDADLMRVAKLDGQAVGFYQLRELGETTWELVGLAVARECRHHGLGRWLLGHAIGIAESKGGREIRIRSTRQRKLLARTGFVAEGDALVLRLTPE